MKAGLSTSLILHATLIGFGVFSLSAPPAFEVADVESLPVDIVSVSEFAEIMRGDKKAPAEEKPAPVPTERRDVVEDAQNFGDNTVDLDTAPTPEPRPRPVENTAKADPAPVPEPKPENDPVETARVDPAPVPAVEVTPTPTEKADVSPQAAEETAVTDNPDAETVELPERAPVPEARPEPPKAATAKAPERKDSDEPAIEKTAKRDTAETEFNADEIAQLLNQEKASGGGAERSVKTAALGNNRDSDAKKLSQGEMDALRSQLESCWGINPGTEGMSELRASVQFKVDITGRLDGRPVIVQSSGNRQFDDSAVRAVQICDRRGLQLPKDKHTVWADIIVNFDPSEMF
ncbi:MAG: TonB family protein [Rhizobiaceae bacterium]